MQKRSILLTISLSSLVAMGCDSTASSPNDGGVADATTTTDSPSSNEAAVDAAPDSPGEAALDAGQGVDAGDGGDAQGAEAGDAQGTEAGDALSPVDSAADAGDAPSLVDVAVDAKDALSLPDALDSALGVDAGD